MAMERKRSPHERNGKEEEEGEELQKLEEEAPSSKRDHERKSKRKKSHSSDDGEEKNQSIERDRGRNHSKSKKKRRSRSSRSRKRYNDEDLSSSSFDSDSGTSYSDSEFESSDYSSEESESEDERRRRRKRKERKRKEREYEKERRRKRRDKEKKGKKKDKDGKDKSKKKKKKSKSKEEKKGAVTNSWGKYGIIRETDMWNKRPEFTAWLSEVKQVNLETLPNWEEKQMFKQFMEDHNTATFPSKKYYSLDAYHRRQIEKEVKKGFKRANQAERTVFNDEEQRRLEMMQVREKQKEAEVETLKIAMQSGMAQAMKEQAQLREEMAYQYKLGNFEAAAAIQRRLDPDVPQ